MRAAIEMEGKRFGRLLVLGKSPKSTTHHAYWTCLCDCGRKYVARGALLRDGKTSRCQKCASTASARTRSLIAGPAADAASIAEVYRLATARYVLGCKEMAAVMESLHRWLLDCGPKRLLDDRARVVSTEIVQGGTPIQGDLP